MYNTIEITMNDETSIHKVNQNDRSWMLGVIAKAPQKDNYFSNLGVLAYAKIVGRKEVPFTEIEKWVDENDVWVEAQAPKATQTVESLDTSSE